MAGILSTGITGIQAAQLGLQVTQHNIANVNTPGYNRQFLLQSAGVAQATGSGFMGSGTSVDSVRRAYDKYLTEQTFVAQSRVSESETMLAKLSQIDNMFGDATSGLTSALQDFFKGVQQVAANPSLVSARQSMISASESLASRFNSMSDRLSELYEGVNGEITSEIEVINSYAAQLADVNGEIMRAEAASQQPANDLLDMRDQLVADLNKHIKVTTVEDSTGAFNVFVGSGQQLVVGTVVNQMVPMTSSNDPERIVVGLKGPSGSTLELPERLIQGGSLGGLISFRAGTLDTAANSLGTIAASLALTFNAQHRLGQDLDGLNATSGPGSGFQEEYFQIPAPRVSANPTLATPNPNAVTADFLLPSGDPATGGFYTKLTGSDYALRSDGTNFTLTRLDGTGTAWTDTSIAGLNSQIVNEGIELSGAIPSTDVDYLIQPTRQTAFNIKLNPAIAADTSRIAVAAPAVTSLGNANVGSLAVSQGVAGFKTDGTDYSLPAVDVQFDFDGSAFTFTPSAGDVVTAVYQDGTSVDVSAGPTIDWQVGGSQLTRINYNGITIDLSGMPAVDDTFTLAPNINGVSDSRNAVKLAALQVQNTMKDGEATFQGYYASMVSLVGNETRQVKVDFEARSTLLEQSQMARSQLSGVNLDEEAANLIKYQQAYQAAAKALEIASKLFDSLLSI